MAEMEVTTPKILTEQAEARRREMLAKADSRRRQGLEESEPMTLVLEPFDSGVRFDKDLARAFDMFANQSKPVTQELIVLLQILREVQRVGDKTTNGQAPEADVRAVEAVSQ